MCERLGVASLFDHAEWIRQEEDKNHLAIFRKKRLRPFRRFLWMPVSTWEARAEERPCPSIDRNPILCLRAQSLHHSCIGGLTLAALEAYPAATHFLMVPGNVMPLLKTTELFGCQLLQQSARRCAGIALRVPSPFLRLSGAPPHAPTGISPRCDRPRDKPLPQARGASRVGRLGAGCFSRARADAPVLFQKYFAISAP